MANEFDALYRGHIKAKRPRAKAERAPRVPRVVAPEIPPLPGRCATCDARLYLALPHWLDESGHPHLCRQA